MHEHECQYCGRAFGTKKALGYHITLTHLTVKNEFQCKCGAIIKSVNTSGAKCRCGAFATKIRKECNVCGCVHYASIKAKDSSCRDCGIRIRAEKRRGIKRPDMDCKASKLWDVPEKDLKGKPDDVKQAIKCCYFVNRKLANRLIAEAKTYDDVVRIRCEYEKENRKEQTFGVVQYG